MRLNLFPAIAWNLGGAVTFSPLLGWYFAVHHYSVGALLIALVFTTLVPSAVLTWWFSRR